MLNSSALIILTNDKGTNVSKYFYSPYSPDGAGLITRSGDLPDQIETDYVYVNVPGIYSGFVDTFQGHFFDPDTKKKWLGNTSPTAMSRFLSHYNNAKYHYWRNRTVSLRELGMSMHYLADLNAPHHASNNTALPLISNSTHAKFEGWVDNNFSYAALSRSGLYPEYYKTITFGVESQATSCALNAKYYSKYAASFLESDWRIAAGECIPRAQREMAAVYYKFLKDVGEKV